MLVNGVLINPIHSVKIFSTDYRHAADFQIRSILHLLRKCCGFIDFQAVKNVATVFPQKNPYVTHVDFIADMGADF